MQNKIPKRFTGYDPGISHAQSNPKQEKPKVTNKRKKEKKERREAQSTASV